MFTIQIEAEDSYWASRLSQIAELMLTEDTSTIFLDLNVLVSAIDTILTNTTYYVRSGEVIDGQYNQQMALLAECLKRTLDKIAAISSGDPNSPP